MKRTFLIITALLACVIFFASCKKEEFTVTFNPNGGSGNIVTQKFKENKSQSLMANSYTKTGFSFSGWNTKQEGTGTAYKDKETIEISQNLELYAQWQPLSGAFTVSFNANGGTGYMEPQLFLKEEYKSLSKNTFQRSNFLFSCWNTNSDGSGLKYRNVQMIELNYYLVLYAQWINPDNNGVPCPGMPTVKDIDGNTYNTVQIGSQCWMRENLRTTKFTSGENIPVVTGLLDWMHSYTSAMCYYQNIVENALQYGALYNFFVLEEGAICPEGWRVPSNADWNSLAYFFDGLEVAGNKMKTTYDWDNNGNGSNESGFSALPSGYRHNLYGFNQLGTNAYYWSYPSRNCYSISTFFDELKRFYAYPNEGYSVRCIKD
jgi:uncharacterized protein (TIGR02145 family)/uncharacterized repeat protein (TIGR02543 family)